MRRQLLLPFVTLSLSTLLFSCKSSQSPIFFTSPMSPYPDLPLPASFNPVSQSPAAAGSPANARTMERLYSSNDAIEPITKFFADKLPKQGWIPQGQTHTRGQSIMKFTKGPEILLIELWNGSTLTTNARLRISPATIIEDLPTR
jgi:hypothetical protein